MIHANIPIGQSRSRGQAQPKGGEKYTLFMEEMSKSHCKEATEWEIFLLLFSPPHLSISDTALLAFNSAFIYFYYPSFLWIIFLPLVVISPHFLLGLDLIIPKGI